MVKPSFKILLKKTFVVCMLILAFANSHAQTKFYTQLSEPKIVAGQSFQVRYIIEGAKEIGQVKLPDYPGFQLLNIYEVPSSQKIDPATNKAVNVYSRVVVLSSTEAGTQIIKGAIAQIDGKVLRSNNVRVDIKLPGSQQGDTGVEDVSEVLEGENIEQKLNDNFFLVSEVSKKTCYVGEPILAVIKACSRLNATSQVTRRPSFTGFSVIEMVDNYDKAPTVENIGGQNFYVHLIRKVQLLPLQPGRFKIDEAEVESTVRFLVPDNDMDFEKVLKGKPELKTVERDVTLKSPVLDIVVSPLPDSGQPASFNGAVGKFSILASVKEREISDGAPGLLKVIIRGQGNLPLVTAPEIPSTDKYRVTASGVKNNIDPYKYPVEGFKEFEYQVTPKVKGNIEMPAVSFAYFDPAKKEYVTANTNPVYFHVKSKNGAAISSNDNTTTGSQKKSIPEQYIFFGFIALGILGWIGYQVWTGKKKPSKEIVAAQPVAEIMVEENELVLADEAMKEGNQTAFLRAIRKHVYQKLGKEYGFKATGMSRHAFIQQLQLNGASPVTVQRADQLLADCEWNLYAPGREVDMMTIRKEAGLI